MTAAGGEATSLSPGDDEKKIAGRQFRIFLLVHFLVWTIVPLARAIPHYDSTEALAWGMTLEWGTNKHPPLSGWVVEGVFRLLGDPDLAIYATGQICVLIALIFIRRLAREFLPPVNSLFSAMFLEGCVYYTFYSTQYNVNVLSLAILPVLAWCCFRAAATDKWRHWLGTGVLAGLALLAKYSNALFLLSLAAYFLCVPANRRLLRRPGPYAAAVAALSLFLPHLLWLLHHDFQPLVYSQVQMESGVIAREGSRLVETLDIFLGQWLNFLPGLGLFAYLHFATPGERRRRFQPRIHPFVICAGFLPLVLLSGMVAVGGMHARTMWAFAFVGYFPLLLFSLFPLSPPPRVRRRLVALTYAAMALTALAYLIKVTCFTSVSANFDGRAFAAAVAGEWRAAVVAPLRRVGGAVHLVHRAAAYAPGRPRPFFLMDPRVAVWEDMEAVRRDGVLVLAYSPDEYARYRRNYPGLPEPRLLSVPMRSRFGGERMFDLYLGVLPPEEPEK